MSTRSVGWLCALAVLFGSLLTCTQAPRAQDGHARWHEYYRHWQQPNNPGLSCCNARVIGPSGEDVTGDCEPTRAEIRGGQWWAWLRQESRWIEIPDTKIVRERNPAGEEAHLCASKNFMTWQVLCFVPPDTGG